MNEPAFPSLEPFEHYDEMKQRYVTVYQPVGGMTLRDYLAGQALSIGGEWFHNIGAASPEAIAGTAYEVADAMLKAREAK